MKAKSRKTVKPVRKATVTPKAAPVTPESPHEDVAAMHRRIESEAGGAKP